jgi:hypothetical protein
MQLERERLEAGSVATEVERYRSGDAGAVDELARRATRLALRTSAAQTKSGPTSG